MDGGTVDNDTAGGCEARRRRAGPGIRAWVLAFGAGLVGPWVTGCGDPPPAPAQPEVRRLDDHDRLLRISMAIRGIRPSLADYGRLDADPAVLSTLVDEWLEDPLFGETVKDVYAEAMKIRADTEPILLSQGPLIDTASDRIFEAESESALRLIEHVVMEDRPFTEIVTADYLMANDVLGMMYGVPYDPGGAEWQQTVWGDDRPVAGILSDNGLWMRYPSNGSNFHRGRANFVAGTLLCDDFNKREIAVEGGIDLSDEQAVANAVTSLPNCVGCHQALEPLATFFWGFKQDTLRTASFRAYFRFDCEGEAGDYCYPLAFYEPDLEDDWSQYGLQPPAYFGKPGRTFTDLGYFVADDPRFAECAARRFQGYLTQTDPLSVPVDVVAPLQQTLVDSGFSVKAVVKAIVMSDAFRVDAGEGPPGSAGLQTVRPEQYARTIADLTGFEMRAAPGCGFDGCFDDIQLGTSDRFGFRAMSGGIDGLEVTRPTHTPTPTKLLFMRYYSAEAAGFVVLFDGRIADAAARKLFTVPGALEGGSDQAVRDQIAALHGRVLGEFVSAADPEVDATKVLYDTAIARGDSPAVAWEQVLTALFQDLRMLFY